MTVEIPDGIEMVGSPASEPVATYRHAPARQAPGVVVRVSGPLLPRVAGVVFFSWWTVVALGMALSADPLGIAMVVVGMAFTLGFSAHAFRPTTLTFGGGAMAVHTPELAKGQSRRIDLTSVESVHIVDSFTGYILQAKVEGSLVEVLSEVAPIEKARYLADVIASQVDSAKASAGARSHSDTFMA
jgi:hypothetical protein